MGQYILTIKNKDYKVNVKKIEGMRAEIEIDGKALTVHIEQLGIKREPSRTQVKKKRTPSETRTPQTPTPAEHPKSGGKTMKVNAPIPGVILKIDVAEGDAVKAGQDLLVMEAMKMENQIQATLSGRIAKINVRVDDSVQQDDVLLEIERS